MIVFVRETKARFLFFFSKLRRDVRISGRNKIFREIKYFLTNPVLIDFVDAVDTNNMLKLKMRTTKIIIIILKATPKRCQVA